ncbi:M20 aminoacylase family protein [Defluviimonas aestuarii]|uniref:M20 aminoacylase family protein n=1 Tax=Albidovulum aestuarii TaxID=1130726 RepID=UPI002499D0FB|nr:M20 aminoacylase family protein [Defluviimonas aestuarii]MDI3334852.1 M20 aminoacylase family protein [Defluviimonas aestuarii]
MPVLNRIADFAPEMAEWRRHLHAHPELRFDCHKTAAFVAERLREFGVDQVHEGIATSGIVAIIEGQGDGPTIGLRADMDALPITEETGVPHASTVPGVMHACGHDGHTAMLLGAAKYLTETRRFRGRVALIFQPAEEDGGGGEAMVREGILDRFGIGEVYALHNTPTVPLGRFVTTPGPIMAAVDTARVKVTGKGGHGAYPHSCIDPIPAMVSMVNALQTIASRNVNPLDEVVVSVTEIHAGTANNIIPETGWFGATIRTFSETVRMQVKQRFEEIVAGQATSFGVTAEVDYELGYPATVNDPDRTVFAAGVAREVAGAAGVADDAGREMGAEDFSYLLEKRPGCYLFLGQGEGAGLHHPAYEFNDEAAPFGASFFARLVERAQPV